MARKKKSKVDKVRDKLKKLPSDIVTAKKAPTTVERNDKGHFLPGNTEAKGLHRKHQREVSEYIMKKSNNLRNVIDEAFKILHDEKTLHRDKIKIIEVILSRAIGKPVQINQSDSEQPLPTLVFNFNNAQKEDDDWQKTT